jgi:formate-dependent nitrite reductase membrane component NrfD
MIEKFTVGLHGQREWAWLLALYLFLGSLGGSLDLFYRLFGLPVEFAGLALLLVLAGAVTLLFKLGNPVRAWRAAFRPGTSWISRGVLCVTGFLVFGAASVAPALGAWVPALKLLPWAEGSGLGRAFGAVAALFALAVTIYPGFVVSSARGIAFWNTPMLPLLFFTYAALSASGVVLIVSPTAQFAAIAGWLAVANALLLAVYLAAMNQAGGAGRESVRRLNAGSLGAAFWIGVAAVGLALPLLLTWRQAAPALAGACLLAGGLLLRYCVLKAGVYVPAPIAPASVDFSRLNRTSAELEREYRAAAAHGGRRA